MRGFVLIAVMAVAVNARPEPPLNGYNYQQPAAPQPISSGGYNGNSQQIGFGSAASGGYQAASSGFSNGHGHQQQSFSQVAPSFNSQPAFQQSFQPHAQPQTIVQKHM